MTALIQLKTLVPATVKPAIELKAPEKIKRIGGRKVAHDVYINGVLAAAIVIASAHRSGGIVTVYNIEWVGAYTSLRGLYNSVVRSTGSTPDFHLIAKRLRTAVANMAKLSGLFYPEAYAAATTIKHGGATFQKLEQVDSRHSTEKLKAKARLDKLGNPVAGPLKITWTNPTKVHSGYRSVNGYQVVKDANVGGEHLGVLVRTSLKTFGFIVSNKFRRGNAVLVWEGKDFKTIALGMSTINDALSDFLDMADNLAVTFGRGRIVDHLTAGITGRVEAAINKRVIGSLVSEVVQEFL